MKVDKDIQTNDLEFMSNELEEFEVERKIYLMTTFQMKQLTIRRLTDSLSRRPSHSQWLQSQSLK